MKNLQPPAGLTICGRFFIGAPAARVAGRHAAGEWGAYTRMSMAPGFFFVYNEPVQGAGLFGLSCLYYKLHAGKDGALP